MAPEPTTPTTSIVKDALPDAAIIPDDGRFDADFEYLAPKVSEEQNKPVEPAVVAKPNEDPPKAGDPPTVPIIPTIPVKDEEPDIASVRATLTAEFEKQKSDLVAQHQAEMAKYESTKVAVEAIEADPVKYIHKYFPALADKIDPNQYITGKLQEQFGVDFRYDATEAYDPSSQSYKFRLRESELRDQLLRERTSMMAKQQLEQERMSERLKASQSKVMKDYGITADQFKTEIVDWFANNPLDFDGVAKLRYFDRILSENVKKAVADAKINTPEGKQKGAADIHSNELSEVPEHLKEFHDEFGD